MDVSQRTFNAFQLKQSHVGGKVKFDHDGRIVEGILWDLDNTPGGIHAELNVDGDQYSVTKFTLVEVA